MEYLDPIDFQPKPKFRRSYKKKKHVATGEAQNV